ncbi:hypothetical protein CSKR_111917 [Clonorchis sinensis]|uniref:Uncharacterized protein n=1 Tax=Clonorchis sinensis TaxID=79923 RepID=A0A419QHP7_CLOSI|nr:hypothetical protein CSKR_111917 [Clonorchis sinensis]
MRKVFRLFLSLQLIWLFTSEHILAWPTIQIPRDMWEPEIFPHDVPRLSAKNAIAVSNMDKQGKPPVMQDLSHIFGRLEMDDEYTIPQSPNFAVVTEGGRESLEENKEDDKADNELDQIVGEEQAPQKGAKLLSGLYGTYGTYGPAAVSLVPVVQTAYQAQAYVPVAVPVQPVVHVQPVVQVPKLVAVMQPTHLVQSSVVSGLQSQQQSVVTGLQPTVTDQQSRMTIPQQVIQPQQVVQPQPIVQQPQVVQTQPAVQPQTVIQPQPAIQPQPDFQTQGRMQLPDTSGVNTQTGASQTQQQQQTSQQSSVTIRHQIAPQHIHIVIPKSKQPMKAGHHKSYY